MRLSRRIKVVEKMRIRWWRVVTWGGVAVVAVVAGTGTGTVDGGRSGGRRVAASVEVAVRGHLWKECSWVLVLPRVFGAG